MKQSLNTPLVLIPAAGYGQRVGSPPAKELLAREGSSDALIEAPLRWCKEFGLAPLVITRHDKVALNEYLQHHHPHVAVVKIAPTDDWPLSILSCESLWGEQNLVLLPDVQFQPLSLLEVLASGLESYDVVVATHRVSDPSSWGFIYKDTTGLENSLISVWEKPPREQITERAAWGLFGFRKKVGRELLEKQRQSQVEGRASSLRASLGEFALHEFKDLMR